MPNSIIYGFLFRSLLYAYLAFGQDCNIVRVGTFKIDDLVIMMTLLFLFGRIAAPVPVFSCEILVILFRHRCGKPFKGGFGSAAVLGFIRVFKLSLPVTFLIALVSFCLRRAQG